MRMRHVLLTVLAAAACRLSAIAAGPALDSDVKSGLYPAGQTFTFTLLATNAQTDIASARLELTYGGSTNLPATPQRTPEGQGFALSWTPTQDGWYLCKATQPGRDGAKPEEVSAGVLVNPDGLRTPATEPADFDAFWAEKRAQLAAAPAEPVMSEFTADQKRAESNSPAIPALEAEGYRRFSVSVPTVPGIRPLEAYYVVPPGSAPKSRPAILYLRAAGVAGHWCRANSAMAMSLAKRYNAIVLDLNAHGMLNGQSNGYYKAMEEGELKGYSSRGKEDRDAFYFVGMYQRFLRAVEFIARQPEWNGKHLLATGESQGGGQALAVAGLDPRVSGVVAIVPAMCNFAGPLGGQPACWPKPLGWSPADIPAAAGAQRILAAVLYCDNVFLAKRSRADTLILAGLADTTCPAAAIYCAYNNLPGPKRIVLYPHKPHQGLPEADAWIGKIDTLTEASIRAHFAAP